MLTTTLAAFTGLAFGRTDEAAASVSATTDLPTESYFSDSAGPDRTQTTGERERRVSVDIQRLWGGLSKASAGTSETVVLDPFPDFKVTLQGKDSEARPDGLSWHGRSTTAEGDTAEAVLTIGYPSGKPDESSTIMGTIWLGNRVVDISSSGPGLAIFDERSGDATDARSDDSFTQPEREESGETVRAADTVGPSAGVIDVMYLYTPAAKAQIGGTDALAQQWIATRVAEFNAANTNSGVSFTIRAAFVGPVGYTEAPLANDALNSLANAQGAFGGVPTLRNDYGADLVQLVGRAWVNNGVDQNPGEPGLQQVCGVGNLPASVTPNSNQVYSVVDSLCNGLLSAHELGHNFALHHDHANDPGASSPYLDAYGHRVNGQFATIMAYTTGCNPACPLRPNWSNPNVTVNGFATGITNYAFNARVMNVGAPVATDQRRYPTPFGAVDGITRTAGGVFVTGWALDFNTTNPLAVRVTVDGTQTGSGTADISRPDIGSAFGMGANHGFRTLAGLSSGPHNICVFATNQGAGLSDGLIGCVAYTASGNPYGVFGVHDYPGGVRFAGWAIDADTGDAINVQASFGGTTKPPVLAQGSRPDVAAVEPLAGPNHGFDNIIFSSGHGTFQACTTALNFVPSPGANVALTPGCTNITLNGTPYGAYGASKDGVLNRIKVDGWALDPDVAASIHVHVYVDGVGTVDLLSSSSRPDIASAYPGYGAAHGFSWTSGFLSLGQHTICAYGINNEPNAANPLLHPGCISVTL